MKFLLRNLAVGAAYVIAGRLALLLAIPPGYATPVWPAIGIALVAALVWGVGVWPGIVAGSFLVNVSTSWDPATQTTILRSLAIPLSVGVGTALQTIAGAKLILRFAGPFDSSLFSPRKVLRLLALAGPVSCMVSATWGVTTLGLAEVVPTSSYLFNWWNWWVGDTIGVLTVLPCALIWRLQPRKVWLSRQLGVSALLGITFFLLVILFYHTSRLEQNRLRATFDRRVETRADTIQNGLNHVVDILYVIREHFASSEELLEQNFKPLRRQFHALASPVLKRQPWIQALSWNPRVSDEARAAYESAAHEEGQPSFQIMEQNSEGRFVPASRRPEYCAVYFIEPFEGNEAALGFDVASDPIRRRALSKARDTGQPQASRQINLVQESSRQTGFLIFLPVYHPERPTETVEGRREHLLGFVVGAFRVGPMIEKMLNGLDPSGIEFRLYDETPPREDLKSLYETPNYTAIPPSSSRPFARTLSFEVAGQPWTLECFLRPDYLDAHRSWVAWGFLAAGLLWNGLLGAFLLIGIGRTLEVEQEAEQRTRVIEATPNAMVLANREGLITLVNSQTEKLLGYHRSELIGKSVEILVPTRFRSRHLGYRLDFLRNRQTRQMGAGRDLFALRKNGVEIPVEIGLNIVETPRGTQVLEAIIDTSERRRAEELTLQHRVQLVTERAKIQRELKATQAQLIQSEKMAAVGQIASGVAHEVKNPLAIIAQGVSFLKSNPAPPPDQRAEVLTMMADSMQRADRIIHGLLTFARPAALQPQTAKMNQVLENALLLVEKQLSLSNITVVKELATNVSTTALDPNQMEQVFINLLTNACQAMPLGGRLTLRTAERIMKLGQPGVGRRATDIFRPEELVVVSEITDTGCGIPSANLSKVFDPFFTTKPMGQGTGLGLTIVRSIVEAHGGLVQIESVEGQGTTVRIALPLKEHAPGAST